MNRHAYEQHVRAAPRLLSEINVTPFIDVMLVLLIIFMVTAPLMMVGVPLKLPKASAQALSAPNQPLVVSLDKERHLFIAEQPISAEALSGLLAERAKADPNLILYVRADKEVDYGQIMDLLARLGSAGVSRLSLIAEGQPVPRGALP
ncbi:MAG TPA: ExbD/TolR family protein [Candidatus Sulfotelmatobacter sp.]|jgi:biopolymer transport protein ExbD|nr:ExbD/TolR family protein [Candidatus Sulfotelmatobacter sp.]